MQDNQHFWQDIYAPTIVAVPPSFARTNLTWCADGSLRHYGRMMLSGHVTQIFASSTDMGLSWKTQLKDNDDPGPMVKCPWADYWLGLISEPTLTAVRSKRGPGFPADETFTTSYKYFEGRPLLPLVRRHRWISAISDIACADGICYHAGVCFSDDDGKTWTYVQVPIVPDVEYRFACDKRNHWFNNGCEPTIAELADGTLLMALRTSGEYAAFTRSTDGGETWEVPKPVPGFWQANTMPELLTLRDGRLIFVWNNTAMLPTRDPADNPELYDCELEGTWETVFTNRDALHIAISDDQGKTWHGYRELLLNEIRNDADFRELGNDNAQEHDKSVHQTQMLELPNGKILISAGQNSASRKLVIFDPDWIYETTRKENFQHGLGAISHHLYVKSPSGGWSGWGGHCAWNRVPGVVLAREPETDPEALRFRESLWLCRINDQRLYSTKAGAVWNFPAARSGVLELDFRIEGDGFQIALQDHWSNPSDEYLVPRSFITHSVTSQLYACASQWVTLKLEWNCDTGKACISCNGKTNNLTMKLDGFAAAGPSYLHLQTLAELEDQQGTFFREFRFTAL